MPDDNLNQLASEGFVLLRSAVEGRAIIAYCDALQATTADRLILVDHDVGVTAYDPARLRVPLNRLTDTHWPVAAGRELLAASGLVSALQDGLGTSQILCFETFHLEVGLAMRMHRESWFVGLRDRQSLMLTAWIALDTIESGSGELLYVPGSQLWNGYDEAKIPEAAVVRFGAACMNAERFVARAGDVLITRGDLGIGGAPVPAPVPDCRMFVAHFCALREDPGYFELLEAPYRVKRQLTRELYSATVYAGRY